MAIGSLIKSTGSAAGLRLAGALCGFLAQLLLARSLSPQELGIFFLVVAIAVLLELIISSGYDTLGLTKLTSFRALGYEGLVHRYCASVFREMAWICLLVSLVLTALLMLVPLEATIFTALYWALIVGPAVAFMNVFRTQAMAARQLLLAYGPEHYCRPALFLTCLTVLLHWQGTLSFAGVIGLFTATVYICCLAQFYFLYKTGTIGRQSLFPSTAPKPVWRKQALTLLVTNILTFSTAELVILIGGLIFPANDIALLGICLRMAVLVGFISQVGYQIVLPDLAALQTFEQRSAKRYLLLQANVLGLAIPLCSILGIIIFGNQILGLFGEAYRSGYILLIIFTVGQIIRTFFGLNAHLLNFSGLQIETAKASLLALITLVIAVPALTVMYDLVGLSFAVLLSDLVWGLCLCVSARLKLDMSGDLYWLFRRMKDI